MADRISIAAAVTAVAALLVVLLAPKPRTPAREDRSSYEAERVANLVQAQINSLGEERETLIRLAERAEGLDVGLDERAGRRKAATEEAVRRAVRAEVAKRWAEFSASLKSIRSYRKGATDKRKAD